MSDKNRLLNLIEIGSIYPDPKRLTDGQVRRAAEICIKQDATTLRAVGEWLQQTENHTDNALSFYRSVLLAIPTLKSGRMPEVGK